MDLDAPPTKLTNSSKKSSEFAYRRFGVIATGVVVGADVA
jgi:hypothetical protein